MLESVLHNNKPLGDKIEDLRKIISAPSFLSILQHPLDFLNEIIPFAAQVFRDLPPDSEMKFGQSNDMRVFFMRLLSKFKYKGYNNPFILELVYDLIQHENIFNRYLSLKILFPILDSDVPLNIERHLKCLCSFFRNELPISDSIDNSLCELGFFAVAEVLNYLKCFHKKYSPPVESYDEIISLLVSALRLYFTQKLIEKFCTSKKVVCEFCSMGVNLIKFTNVLSITPNHFIYGLLADLCYALLNMSPSDSYYLRKDILLTILDTFYKRTDAIYALDRYFLKNPYLHSDFEPLQVYNLYFLSELVTTFGNSLSNIVCFEFDQRISECIPTRKSLPILGSCIHALCTNFTNALNVQLEAGEMKIVIFRHLKMANRIYKLLHLPTDTSNDASFSEFLSTDETQKFIPSNHTDSDVTLKYMEYLKMLVKSISFIQLQNKPFEKEQNMILGNFLMFPLAREMECSDFLALFNAIPVEVLERIISSVVDSIIIRFYRQVGTWNVLLAVPEVNCLFIKAANSHIHYDVVHRSFRPLYFYQCILPLAYGFFKIDKKYIKPDFSECFAVIYDSLLHSWSFNDNGTLTHKEAVGLINSMFLDVKNCDVAYTGLYFIYNYFEASVRELYTSYTLTFDSFYLEVLFNIPVSLNLLVTKYSVLMGAMEAGLNASRRVMDIIIKYVEYIVEFENEHCLMDELLERIYDIMVRILKTTGVKDASFSKGINVFSRINNRHRGVITEGKVMEELPESDRIRCEIRVTEEETGVDNVTYIEDNGYESKEIEEVMSRHGTVNEKADKRRKQSIACDKIRRQSLPLLTGYEFIYVKNSRGERWRILRASEVDRKMVGSGFNEHVRETLCTYLGDLLRMLDEEELSFEDEEIAKQSSSDILFGLLLSNEWDRSSDDKDSAVISRDSAVISRDNAVITKINAVQSISNHNTLFIELTHNDLFNSFLSYKSILPLFIPDSLIYAPTTSFMLLNLMQKNLQQNIILCDVIFRSIYALIDFIYGKEEVKSIRALDVLFELFKTGLIFHSSNYNQNDTLMDILHAILFSLKKCSSFRIYLLILNLTIQIGSSLNASGVFSSFRSIFESPPQFDSGYYKALFIEVSIHFSLSPPFDLLPEMDKRCILRLLNSPIILSFSNLPAITESLLKSIDKKDTPSIEKYLFFLSTVKNTPLFNELLAPAKKFLPAIAVLEGFSSEAARHKFVENVNRNGNFQTHNPNSFRIFRNLFHNCSVAGGIKTNFIEIYPSQIKEHRMIILEIFMNSLEYDLSTFDFLISKLGELPLCKNDTITGFSDYGIEIFTLLSERIHAQPPNIRDSLIMYLVEHMHSDFIYYFVDLCILMSNEVSVVLTNFLNGFLNNNHAYREQTIFSKAAYNILRYLRKRKCRFNDNKAVLIVYRDLCNTEDEIESLVNWYFKNFTAEDIELLYRINNGFLITSESILLKLVSVESVSTRCWMIECLRKQCVGDVGYLKRAVSFYLKSRGFQVSDNIQHSVYRQVEGVSEEEIPEIPVFSTETVFVYEDEEMETSSSDLSLFMEEEVKRESKKEARKDVRSRDQGDSHNNFNTGNTSNTGNTNNFNTIINNNLNTSNNSNNNNNNNNNNNTTTNNSNTSNNNNNNNTKIDLLDISFILPYFSDSLHLIIDLFCDFKIFSPELLSKCKDIVSSTSSIRYSALYYLCLFDPLPEYFESIFKLNYQERKYVFPSLQLLISRFGISPFLNSVKTVLRSEMRFRTTQCILLPFLLNNHSFLDSPDIFFELCIFIHRLARIGKINPRIIHIIMHNSTVPLEFKREIYTLNLINKSITTMENIDSNMLSYTIINGVSGIFALKFLEIFLQGDLYSTLDRGHMVEIFSNNPTYPLSRNAISWLRLPASFYLDSCLDNQITILELIFYRNIDNCQHIDEETTLKLLDSLVNSRFNQVERISAVLPCIIKKFPTSMTTFISSHLPTETPGYPPVFECLPFVFEVTEPEVAISLAMRRPPNMSLDVFESNILHLFKVMPFSMDVLKKEFFSGLCSPNRITRICYLDLLLSNVPKGAMNLLQYIFLFNYGNDIEESQIEYFIGVLLYNSTRPGVRSFYLSSNTRDVVFNKDKDISKVDSNDVPIIDNNIILHHMTPLEKARRKVENIKKTLSNENIKKTPSHDNLSHLEFDSLYMFQNNLATIESLFTGILNSLSINNILYLLDLFNTHFICQFRIKIPFIRTFMRFYNSINNSINISINNSINISINSPLYYNPFNPSLKYYQIIDRGLYLGLIKIKGGIREVKKLVETSPDPSLITLQESFDILKRIEMRQASYSIEDVNFIENEIRIILGEFGIYLPVEENNEIQGIENRFYRILENIQSNRNVLEEVKTLVNSLSILFYLPRNSILFSKLLMFSSITSEIIESLIIIKDNLTESIYGRFRMWMIRHPCIYASLLDWNLFMRWRSFIFIRALGMVSENDKKKVSSELCKLNCIYATKAFKEKLFNRACSILNEANVITTVEISQNMHRILLDLESLFFMKDYSTMVSLINSLNIAKFSNEEKGRLYYWAYKALKKMNRTVDAEKYGSLSRKLFDIIENKKEDLELLKERCRFQSGVDNFCTSNFFTLFSGGAELEQTYISKLIEIINEVSVADSKIYVLELLGFQGIGTADLDSLSHQKLYYFMHQIREIDFLINRNPLLKQSLEGVKIFDEIFNNISIENINNDIGNISNNNIGNINNNIENISNNNIENIFKNPPALQSYLTNKLKDYLIIQIGQTGKRLNNIPLPGEFTRIRNKYDDIKFMEYIEKPLKNSLHVRISDGSISRIISHNSNYSPNIIQFMEIFQSSIRNHKLEKLGFNLTTVPTVKSNMPGIIYSIHFSLDYSFEFLWLIRLFKDKVPLHSIFTEYFHARQSMQILPAFSESVKKWKDTFKKEILSSIPDYNNFYIFKRNFINSYGSIICFSNILAGIKESNYENLFIDLNGNSFMSIPEIGKKFYFRPGLQMIFGAEGINGPLVMFMVEFMQVIREEEVKMIGKLLGVDIRRFGIEEVKDEEIRNSIGEMVDPRVGSSQEASRMLWL